MSHMREMTFSIKNENDDVTLCIHSPNTSCVQVPDSSKFTYLFYPTWLQQGMVWPPQNSQNK